MKTCCTDLIDIDMDDQRGDGIGEDDMIMPSDIIPETNIPERVTWDGGLDSPDVMADEDAERDPLCVVEALKIDKRKPKDAKTVRKKAQKQRPYSQSELEEALSRIRAKEISLTAASKTYSIPKTTLHYQLRVTTPLMLEKEVESITCDVEIELENYNDLESLEADAEAGKGKVRRKERLYTQEELADAVERIRKDDMTLNQASKAFGIPKTTLHSKLHGKTPLICKKGPDRILSKEDECYIATWVTNKIKSGDRVGIDDVKEAVAQLFEDRGQPRTKPGTKWYRLFRQRYRSHFLRKLQGKTDLARKK